MAHHTSPSFRRHSTRVLVLMGLIVGGCAVDEGDEVEQDMFVNLDPQAGGGGSGGDPDTNNRLGDECLTWSGVLATLPVLARGPIADANGNLPSMPNMPSATSTVPASGCRRELLKVVVECALNGAYTYVDPVTNAVVSVPTAMVKDPADFNPLVGPRRYYGRHNLAPAWKNRGLTEDEQEFVTACVMARTNYNWYSVDILMEGHAPIAHDPDLREEYSYAESTVWGNVFRTTPSLHVCHNIANGVCIEANKRLCDDAASNYCGFVNHGDCLDTGMSCSGELGSIPSWCNAWSNRISVFMRESDLSVSCPSPISTEWEIRY